MIKIQAFQKAWISVTTEINKAFIDRDGNIQIKGYLLAELVPESLKQSPAAIISEEASTSILENCTEMKEDTSKPYNIRNFTQTFVIYKFTSIISNASKWMNIFQAECSS